MANGNCATIEYQTKLEKLENELLKLKKAPFGLLKKTISLYGFLKGVEVSEKDIKAAKKSLFREIKP